MLPLTNFLNKLKIQFTKKVSDSPSQNLKLKNSTGNTINQHIAQAAPQPSTEEMEMGRRRQLVAQLRNQWLMSNDGISPARMAGLEWGNGELAWLNQQLAARGENWQI